MRIFKTNKVLDENRTCMNVDDFLTDDFEQLYLSSTRSLSEISSPSLEYSGSSSSKNGVESQLVGGIDVEKYLDCIVATIDSLEPDFRKLLRERYLKILPATTAMVVSGYSSSDYYRKMHKAQKAFAFKFNAQQKKYKLDHKINLLAFIDPKRLNKVKRI